MITEEPEILYKLYPYNHWVTKANMIKSKIDADATAYDDIGIFAHGSDNDRYQRMLKYELHFTYFQQVEALFEILFALQTLDDKHIWFHLSNANWSENYAEIRRIAEGKLDLDEQEVELTNGKKLSFLEWALYAGYSHNFSDQNLKNTIKITKRLLRLAAQDFSDRDAYNSYKHGMRVLPLFGTGGGFSNYMDISDAKTAQKLSEIDFSNSYTYLDIKNKKEFSEVTITYNPEQDISRIRFISLLMFNIIKTRRAKFYDQDIIESTGFSKLDPSDAIMSKHDINKIVITHEVDGKEPSEGEG